MADATPQKRVMPSRTRGDSSAKRRATSPTTTTSTPAPKAAPTTPATTATRSKRSTTKRLSVVNIQTPVRSASTPASVVEEILPTRVANSDTLPTLKHAQPNTLSNKQYQSIAESAVLSASLHRSRMQWLCDGVFTKYWTKPMRRKGHPEPPANNPDVKSMQKLGMATITIEPHAFDVTFYTVKDTSVPPQVMQQPPPAPPNTQTSIQAKPVPVPLPHANTPAQVPPIPTPRLASSTPQPSTTPRPQSSTPQPHPQPQRQPLPTARPAAPPSTNHPRTDPGPAKTTDPVIQMLAARAATDENLKGLMQVVAASKATPDQLREFQAHIDEFNAIVKRQQAERERLARLPPPPTTPYNRPPNAIPSYAPAYPTPPRPEPIIKHIIVEFTSPASSTQSASADRWLFPEYAVLDVPYGGLEMTCSFFVEKKGAELIAQRCQGDTSENPPSTAWDPKKDYYQAVTMTVRANNPKTIETIARSAKSLPAVQQHMKEVMENKTRAPLEYLAHRLPRDKLDGTATDFVDSAVELSEDDELKAFYPT